MRQLIKLSFISGLIVNGYVFAADPVQGFYLGLQGEISHAPTNQFSFTANQVLYSGQITMQPVGAGAGASIGYKIQKFRLEGELLVNTNSYNQAQIGSCTLISPNLLGPRGSCPDFIRNNGLGFKGSTTGAYGLFNVFYDFLSSNPDNNVVPYFGLGLGFAQLKNTVQIENNQYVNAGSYIPIATKTTSTKTGVALQGVLGVNFYIDDFVTIGMDYRYLSAAKSSNSTTTTTSGNSQYAINTLNFVANFALEKV